MLYIVDFRTRLVRKIIFDQMDESCCEEKISPYFMLLWIQSVIEERK